MLVHRNLLRRARVAGRSLSEAPISWTILIGGTAYGLYLLFQGGFNVVKGALVTAWSMVLGVHGVYGV